MSKVGRQRLSFCKAESSTRYQHSHSPPHFLGAGGLQIPQLTCCFQGLSKSAMLALVLSHMDLECGKRHLVSETVLLAPVALPCRQTSSISTSLEFLLLVLALLVGSIFWVGEWGTNRFTLDLREQMPVSSGIPGDQRYNLGLWLCKQEHWK